MPRLVQGAFGALLVPTSLALINATFDGPDRGRAFGIWAAATSALTVGGPVVGGILIDTFGWRSAFLVNVPLVIAGIVIARTQLDESRNPDAPEHFDWLGAAVIALAVGGLAYGATRGQEQQWTDPVAWAALVIGFIAAISLVPSDDAAPQPAGAAEPVPVAELQRHQHLDAPHLRGAVRLFLLPRPVPAGHPGLHRTRLRAWRACQPGWPWRCCRPASVTWRGGSDRGASWPSDRP